MRRIGWVALWSGGSSYSAPNKGRDSEFFPTLEAAKIEFRYRYSLSRAEIRPVYWVGEKVIQSGLVRPNVGTPIVDENAYMYLCPLFDNETVGEWCKLIEFGPHRGIKVTDI